MGKHSLTKRTDAYSLISTEVMGNKYNAVSDLMGGLSGNRARGNWGHKRSYWSTKGALEQEAFAHMYEAQFSADKYALMQKYFPSALAEFEKLLKGVI